jgi:hypothetical protein
MTQRGTRQNRAVSESKIAEENKSPAVKSAEPKLPLREPMDWLQSKAFSFRRAVLNRFVIVDFPAFFPLSAKMTLQLAMNSQSLIALTTKVELSD